ncbi:hypothetical protein [Serratia symbiotica]|uniref:hypothetical protein n=1 Tax=Serratia symbiotica TaxID=138074 RepID=UPI0013283F85|nr:hypothetical protein [Serratia symbiotica]QTP13410.1 hypothetical protein GPZ83_0000280 [Serratia symbiotica]
MNLQATDFTGAMTAIYSSEGKESLLERQSNLAEYGSTLKSALRIMPPDVVTGMFADYKPHTEEKVSHLMNGLLSKELMLEDIAQGNNLVKEWVSVPAATNMSETFNAEDEWVSNDWGDMTL